LARAKKPGLTRRLERQYRSVLSCDGDSASYHYPWQHLVPFDEVNGMCAYFFAYKWRSRDIDLIRLQSIVCRSTSAKAAYLWAKNMKEPRNIRRLQKVIVEHGSIELKRTFAREILQGFDRQNLEALADIQEIMEM